jgi:predicted alpha/beta hydrolase
MKGSFDVAKLDAKGLRTYLGVCSVCLARAHARTGDAAAISGYLGSGDTFDRAISKFAVAYADQTRLDHQALVEAIESGRVAAETGI